MNSATSDEINLHLIAQLDGQPIPAYRSDQFARLVLALSAAAGDGEELQRIGLDTVRNLLERTVTAIHAQREMELMVKSGISLC